MPAISVPIVLERLLQFVDGEAVRVVRSAQPSVPNIAMIIRDFNFRDETLIALGTVTVSPRATKVTPQNKLHANFGKPKLPSSADAEPVFPELESPPSSESQATRQIERPKIARIRSVIRAP